MQTYICEHCDSLECDTSVCPVCGGKTTLVKSEIFYCDVCHCPTYSDTCEQCHSKCRKIGSDVRPVFAKERLLLETLLGEPFKFANRRFGVSVLIIMLSMAKRLNCLF